ncbi:hypothetical protein BK708_37365 [Bacillus thuringiensis serovar yunnanensis]|nr:hypothetical protein BK708_37365 [Bacillus thuringiensis serovar yunnanensis]
MQLKSIYKVLATTAILGQTMVGPVLSHADTVSTKSEIHSQQQNSYENKLGKLPFINFASEEGDFGDKPKEDAKKYVEDEIKEQEKKMSSSDIQTLLDFFKKDNKAINDYLIMETGKLLDKDPLNAKIQKLDDILKRQRTEKTVTVYQSVPKIPLQDALNLKGKILPPDQYRISSLTKDSIVNKKDRPLLEIKVPKGSHALYGMNQDSSILALIERGAGLLVTDVKQIVDKGISRTKIETKLLSSEEIRNREQINDAEVKKAIENLTKENKIKVPVTINSLDPNVSKVIKDAFDVIDQFQGKINHTLQSQFGPNVTADHLFYQFEKNGGKISIHDSLLQTGDNAFINGEFRTTTKEIHLFRNGDGIFMTNTLLHEFGHAYEDLLFNKQLRNDPELIECYRQEGDAFGKTFKDIKKLYAGLNESGQVAEFFAEAFAKFMDENDNQRLKEVTPKTYEKIKQILQKESV